MNASSRPARTAPLLGILVDLLRESTVGLTAATLLDVIQERNLLPEEDVSERGVYQRVLRALQQLESAGLVRKTARRYILDVEAVDHELALQARTAIERALEGTLLTADPDRLRATVDQALRTLLDPATE